ncbi:hypothetical protein SESBI_03458 [Sesbania bispinosa]|nr:hypothetical protein SESBI_03458 [Sesbania bispinosa]
MIGCFDKIIEAIQTGRGGGYGEFMLHKKVRFFAWLALHNSLPTRDVLYHKGVVIVLSVIIVTIMQKHCFIVSETALKLKLFGNS